ncbi:flavin monoamine oxidase family protein [Smaragdicoccus niigatensis]|uniref:flavin monoamine oxidase family protein n=1 Tax=Smaragdicoccus niigatensis TaxID=359359 RepID=UPI00039F6BC7|nr:flavin monoamine oxidase family protein [Smaragdicoccus niigatensis]
MADVDVCVVGAGFAGLTAALRLVQAGRTVAVLEARDRVGGRTFTDSLGNGSYIDRGGAWVGPTQDRIHALMDEFGVPSYKQFNEGANLVVLDGKPHRYKGTVPLKLGPWVTANMGIAFLNLERLCRSIPVNEPWNAPNAAEHDATTLATWLKGNVYSKPAHDLLETGVAGCYTSAASEVSLLFVLFQMASGGGPRFVLGVENGSQDARPVGGMGAIYRPIADYLGERIHLNQPVRSITQDADGATVRAESTTVRASRVIVAVPIAIASHILFDPQLPVDRAMLHQRMPGGSIMKVAAIYDEPFWRADGLTGLSASPGTAAPVTIDACTASGKPGILCVIVEGPNCRRLGRMTESDRRQAILSDLAIRFGPKAANPVDYHEQDWTLERYSGGGMLSHAPTGVLTEFGPALRAPCGRIHWAGTESSPVMCGWVDGAVRSGERAAHEVIDLAYA